MTNIESLEQQATDLSARGQWATRLAAALAPNPSAWEYQGEVVDCAGQGAHCACGHPVRYQFILHRGGDTAAVGSECINHFAGLAPDLHVKLAAAEDVLRQRIAEAKRQAKAVADAAEVATLRTEFELARDAARAAYEEDRSAGRRSPRPLWAAVASNYYYLPRQCPEYQRACDAKKWYRKQTEAWRRALLPA